MANKMDTIIINAKYVNIKQNSNYRNSYFIWSNYF